MTDLDDLLKPENKFVVPVMVELSSYDQVKLRKFINLHYLGDEDAWDCNILEEYLSKSSLVYTPPHYTSLHSLTPQQTIPCNPDITLIPGTPQINNTVRAE